MGARRTVGTAERRARVGLRHRLAPGTQVASVAEAAAAVVVLHATDTASAFLQARARMSASSPSRIDHELYEERSVLRMLAMRRTLFMVPILIGYTVFIYWIFRGKIKEGEGYH